MYFKIHMIKMDTGTYLFFLIFCAILCQEILTLSEEHIEKSWDLHIRKKRLIDKTPNGNKPATIQHVPYIVNIHKNEEPYCGGSILTSSVIITAAHCVLNRALYTVLSGSAHVNQGIRHNVTGKLIHHLYNPHTKQSDLALLHISPAIDLVHSLNRNIELYEGNVPENTLGTLSGWGCIAETETVIRYPKQLRSIVLPIIRDEICESSYSYPLVITDTNICTYSNNKCGGFGDSGDPLVVNSKLVGVYAWIGRRPHLKNPDVFIKVSHPIISNWIIANVRIIEGW